MAALVLRLRELEEGPKDLFFPLSHPWLADNLQGTELSVDDAAEAGSLQLHAERLGDDVLLRGEVRAQLKVPCGRCLEDVVLSLAAPVTVLLSPRASLQAQEDLELTPEDLDRDTYSGDRIELDALVRENLLLAVPMQPLCSEDCAGIPIPAHVKPPADFGSR